MMTVSRGVDAWMRFWNTDDAGAAALVKNEPERFQPVMRAVAKYLNKSGNGMDPAIAVDPVSRAAALKKQMAEVTPAHKLRHDWFGLTYINVVWQEKMVKGMLEAFLGSFLAVFLMMTLLYRSALWGALCMAPLTVTIAMIYGVIGLVGKDYDMPAAVLSSLSLGLAVDYAIHFLTRSRVMYVDYGSWEKTAGPVFGEPARAIARNAIVVGIGFLPLVLAPLVPYQTVGIFIAAILLLAGVSTMLILPAAMRLVELRLFPRTRKACVTCNRGTCIITIVAAVALVMINVQQFMNVGWTSLTWISLPVIVLLSGWCAWMSRGELAKTETFAPEEDV
jgi:predicted RND superfamily exporter protein